MVPQLNIRAKSKPEFASAIASGWGVRGRPTAQGEGQNLPTAGALQAAKHLVLSFSRTEAFKNVVDCCYAPVHRLRCDFRALAPFRTHSTTPSTTSTFKRPRTNAIPPSDCLPLSRWQSSHFSRRREGDSRDEHRFETWKARTISFRDHAGNNRRVHRPPLSARLRARRPFRAGPESAVVPWVGRPLHLAIAPN